MLFLLWLNFGGKMRSRADLAGLVVLAIVYWPLPMLMIGAGLTQFLPAVIPFAVTNALAIAWPAAEVIVVWFLLLLRWRRRRHCWRLSRRVPAKMPTAGPRSTWANS